MVKIAKQLTYKVSEEKNWDKRFPKKNWNRMLADKKIWFGKNLHHAPPQMITSNGRPLIWFSIKRAYWSWYWAWLLHRSMNSHNQLHSLKKETPQLKNCVLFEYPQEYSYYSKVICIFHTWSVSRWYRNFGWTACHTTNEFLFWWSVL